jgi:hypothetical protein
VGKYLRFEPPPRKKKELPPIWRGIGCLLIIFIPALAFGLTALLFPLVVKSGIAPFELLSRIHFPYTFYRVPVISSIVIFLGNIQYPWIKLIVFFLLLVLLTGIFTLSYTIIYQWIGPPRYSKIDVPPSSHKPKKYTR